MFYNLEAELKRKSISRRQAARIIQCNPSTLSFKMSGKRGFTLLEALKLKQYLNVDMTIEDLFATDETQKIHN